MLDNLPFIGQLAEQGYLKYILIVLAVPVLFAVGRMLSGVLRQAAPLEKLHNVGPLKRDPAREAVKLEKKEEWGKAAKIYAENDRVDDAVRCYRAAEDHQAAARLLERHERFDEAEGIYREIEAEDELERLWVKTANWAALGALNLKRGKPGLAAESFVRAGDQLRAAECFAEGEQFENAAKNFEAVQEYARAAEFYEKTYLAQRSPTGGKKNLALKAAECYLRSKNHKAAGVMLEAAERWEDAAKSFAAAGDAGRAGELFYRARKYEQAAQHLREAGQEERAQHVLGEMHEFDGKLAEAGECYRAGGNPIKAGEMFEAAKKPGEAAACYEEGGDYVSAAECYLRAGNDSKAAALFEKQGRFAEAAPLWLKQGDMDKAIVAFDRGGHFYDAGLLLNQLGRSDEAIALFQKLEPESPGFQEGNFVLGSLFRRKKHYGLAVDAFRKASGGKPVNHRNLEIYYNLAETLAADGKPKEALQVYEAILRVKFDYKDVRDKVERLRG